MTTTAPFTLDLPETPEDVRAQDVKNLYNQLLLVYQALHKIEEMINTINARMDAGGIP